MPDSCVHLGDVRVTPAPSANCCGEVDLAVRVTEHHQVIVEGRISGVIERPVSMSCVFSDEFIERQRQRDAKSEEEDARHVERLELRSCVHQIRTVLAESLSLGGRLIPAHLWDSGDALIRSLDDAFARDDAATMRDALDSANRWLAAWMQHIDRP